jgi:ELWxxDGT repeat protein
LVKDIWTNADGSYPYNLTSVGTTLFFAASDGISGTELWKSDGTAGGTVLVKDIWPGALDSYPFSLKSVDGLLYFSANNGIKGDELWKSDGTDAGTVLVKDIWPGQESGAAGNFSSLVNTLLFTGNDGTSGYTTWQSDGTASGTMVSSIGNAGNMQELVETDDNIFASITQTGLGRELWAISYSSLLPLNFLEFKAWFEGNDAVLNWKTDHEVNTNNFIIERSIDGSNYYTVGQIKSFNTPGVHQYAFTDDNAASLTENIFYYRIKQTDIDDRFSYSKIVTLTKENNASSVTIYPNPASTMLNLAIKARQKEKINYNIFDNAGRKVMQQSVQVYAGFNNLSLDINKLAAGVYYIKLSGIALDKRLQFVKR